TRKHRRARNRGIANDLGVCLHFQEEENSILYKTVILKPEWGTSAVYKVLDNQKVIDNQGCFTRNDLKKIWQEEKYTSMRGELLELMKKFQLCYEIIDQKDTFIAPQLLSKIKPDYKWDELNNLILRYAYPDFMPKGIITRLIVVMHKYIDQQKNVWKTGVILNKDSTKAEVIEYHSKREIIIRIFGTNKRNFMTVITHELDKINNSYQRLNCQKLIPCNCKECKNNQNPFTYEFRQLVARLANGKLTIECGKPPSFNEVQVFRLIDNTININQFIPKNQQNRDYNLYQFFGDFLNGNRVTKIGKGKNIERDLIDQHRDVKVSDHAKVNVSGAGAFSLGDSYGAIANNLNQLNFDDPNKNELKQLLIELVQSIAEEDLDEEEKEESLEQISAIADALQNDQNKKLKRKAKGAIAMFQYLVEDLPQNSAMVAIYQELSDAIAKIF
ncbi:MAG: COR domain-containing protein, partial [Cyanobacteria bacterium P01_F01_bin.143]